MRTLWVILLVAAGVGVSGCTAGSAYTHQTFTLMQQANIENAKVLVALHDFALVSEAARDKADISELRDRTKLLVKFYQLQPEDGRDVWLDGQLDKMVAGVSKNLASSLENRRRLALLMDTAESNLAFSNMIADQAKEYIIFRSDIDTQWKAFVGAQMSNLLTENARKTTNAIDSFSTEPKPITELIPK